MKAVILAGGFGSRMSEETHLRPKPMVEIGGKPILWHIMKIYSAGGINEFIVCCGYKGYLIKEYFANYILHSSNVTFDLRNRNVEFHDGESEPWKVTIVDTGNDTMTGGRLKRVAAFLNNEAFCLTYGDGVCDINVQELIASHKQNKVLATVTAVQPPGRFGALDIAENKVQAFTEKAVGEGGWINAGFFVLEPQVLNYIDDDRTVWEYEPCEKLASENQLGVYKHHGFWQAMDTMRDHTQLNKLWAQGHAPWKSW